jgi:Sec-independent protein translocase protein TatA
MAACETAKTKLREALCALSEAVGTIKDAAKEHRAQSADLEKARATLAKLQAMSL